MRLLNQSVVSLGDARERAGEVVAGDGCCSWVVYCVGCRVVSVREDVVSIFPGRVEMVTAAVFLLAISAIGQTVMNLRLQAQLNDTRIRLQATEVMVRGLLGRI